MVLKFLIRMSASRGEFGAENIVGDQGSRASSPQERPEEVPQVDPKDVASSQLDYLGFEGLDDQPTAKNLSDPLHERSKNHRTLMFMRD